MNNRSTRATIFLKNHYPYSLLRALCLSAHTGSSHYACVYPRARPPKTWRLFLAVVSSASTKSDFCLSHVLWRGISFLIPISFYPMRPKTPSFPRCDRISIHTLPRSMSRYKNSANRFRTLLPWLLSLSVKRHRARIVTLLRASSGNALRSVCHYRSMSHFFTHWGRGHSN